MVKENIRTGFEEIKSSILLLIATASYSPARDFTKPTLPPFNNATRLSSGPAARTVAVGREIGDRPAGANALATAAMETKLSAVNTFMVKRIARRNLRHGHRTNQ